MSILKPERIVGIDAVLKASRLCQAVFNKLVSTNVVTKLDHSPVTIADYGAQAVVNSIINAAFPNDPIVGEEDAKELKENRAMSLQVLDLVNSVVSRPLTEQQALEYIDLGTYRGGEKGRFWTLDPIDGTKGFLRGDQYAICLALIIDGRVELAIQGCPNLPSRLNDENSDRGSLFIAVKGEGAYERSLSDSDERRIRVSDVSTAAETVFCESFEAGHSSQSETEKIASILNISQKPVRMDSQCKYGVIARGQAGIYLRIPTRPDYQEKIWVYTQANHWFN